MRTLRPERRRSRPKTLILPMVRVRSRPTQSCPVLSGRLRTGPWSSRCVPGSSWCVPGSKPNIRTRGGKKSPRPRRRQPPPAAASLRDTSFRRPGVPKAPRGSARGEVPPRAQAPFQVPRPEGLPPCVPRPPGGPHPPVSHRFPSWVLLFGEPQVGNLGEEGLTLSRS